MNPKRTNLRNDPFFALTPEAMRLARLDAEELAIATGTALIQVVDGEIVRFYPTRNASEEPQPVATPLKPDT